MTESVVGGRYKDCLPCRIISGTGVLGMGAYLWIQAKKRPQTIHRFAMYGVATVAGAIGVTRLLDLYPFSKPQVTD